MKMCYLIMLLFGGVIGIGLFFNIGYIIFIIGVVGMLLVYLIGVLVVWLVMQCFGELLVVMFEIGVFYVYVVCYFGLVMGYIVVWFYWLMWMVVLGLSFIVVGFCMQYWFLQVLVWIWCVVFCVVIFGFNIILMCFFVEGEFWFLLVKVIIIVVFIIFGGVVIFGIILMQDGLLVLGLCNIIVEGWFLYGGLLILMIMVVVNFVFFGMEFIGIVVGEMENLYKVILVVICIIIVWLIIFFIGIVFVLVVLILMQQVGVEKSFFVLVFEKVGIFYVVDMFNFVILMVILLVVNFGLYVFGWMLWLLLNEKMLLVCFVKVNKWGVLVIVLLVSMLGGVLVLFFSVVVLDMVFVVLLVIFGFVVVVVWLSICVLYFMFCCCYLQQGKVLSDFQYCVFWYLVVFVLGFVLCLVVCVGFVFDLSQRIVLWCGIFFVVLCYGVWYFICLWNMIQEF